MGSTNGWTGTLAITDDWLREQGSSTADALRRPPRSESQAKPRFAITWRHPGVRGSHSARSQAACCLCVFRRT
jgi:hypothetical protein